MGRAEHSREPFLQEILQLEELSLLLVGLIPGDRLELYAVAESLGPDWKILGLKLCGFVFFNLNFYRAEFQYQDVENLFLGLTEPQVETSPQL